MNTFTSRHVYFQGLTVCLLFSLFFFNSARAAFPFQSSSPLSSGKWVKVKVDKTGLYEISYESLKEMGFPDPARVGVYGKGGIMMPQSFMEDGDPLFEDGLVEIGVIHHDNKLYFYGRSTEDIEFKPSGTRFEKVSRNIYSNFGAYFLSDNKQPLEFETAVKPSGNAKDFSLGYDFVYHEEDLQQNTEASGQIFWGEDLKNRPDGYSWQLDIPFIDVNGKAKLDCKVYAADKSSGTMYYGVSDATAGNRTFNVRHPSPASGTKENPEFMHMSNPTATLTLPSPNGEVYVRIPGANGEFINLDYWILSYSKMVPDLISSSSPQEHFSIVMSGLRPGKMTVPYSENIRVIDITNPGKGFLLYSETDQNKSDLSFYFNASGDHRDFIFCDFSKPQLKIKEYSDVPNTDLHSMAAKGADFLIISVPRYIDFAEKLADVHRKYDGIDVIVASSEDIFNEYSGGIPDPMAYRSMMKMTYDASGGKLKNLLFVGKEFGDYRKILDREDARDYIIAYQDNKVSATTRAGHVMDFYGFADDVTYSSLQNNKVHVGVGLLPFFNEQEAEDYLRKVENYISDDSMAYLANEFMTIGGVGDNHTHDSQSAQLGEQLKELSPGGSPLAMISLDAYGEENSKKKILSELRLGKLFTTYTGHGSAAGPDSSRDVWRVSDIPFMNNDKTGFLCIYGCDMSDTDYARKGFGEQIVTDTPNGMVGCMMATRTVWSGQNFELSKTFSNALFADPLKVADKNDPSIYRSLYRNSTPTIGEVYADAKSSSNYINTLSYMYIGDPALKIPVALRSATVDVSSPSLRKGQKFNVKGSILSRDTIPFADEIAARRLDTPVDKGFNGKVIVKLTSPAESMLSRDFISKTKDSGKELYIDAPIERLAEFSGTVIDGEYSIDMILPGDISEYEGKKLQLFISAYDPSTLLAASGYTDIKIEEGAPAGSASDTASPVLEVHQDNASRNIIIKVSDDCGIMARDITAKIDGMPLTLISEDMGTGSKSLELIALTESFKPGEYSLSVQAADIAGNKTEKDLSISLKKDSYPLSIRSDRKVAEDEISFQFNSSDASGIKIRIVDNKGKAVYTDNPQTDEYRWNCHDLSGKKVNSGLYKAKLEGNSETGITQHSGWVYFVVK